MTLQLYLNEGFGGGETTFFPTGNENDKDAKVPVVPRTGMGLLFEHHIMHEGSLLVEGIKYSVRTDVMYSSVGPDMEYEEGKFPFPIDQDNKKQEEENEDEKTTNEIKALCGYKLSHMNTLHKKDVRSVAVQMSSGRICSGSRDCSVMMLEPSTTSSRRMSCQPDWLVRDDQWIQAVAILEKGVMEGGFEEGAIGVGFRDGTISIFNIPSSSSNDHEETQQDQGNPSPIMSFHEHTNSITSLRFWGNDPDHPPICKSYLVSGGWDGSAFIFDLATQLCIRTMRGHENNVFALPLPNFSILTGSTGESTSSGVVGQRVRVWEVDEDEKEPSDDYVHFSASVRCISTLSDPNNFLTGKEEQEKENDGEGKGG